MNLSLQVKKFINSEHTGDYVDIRLPLAPEEKGRKPEPVQPEPELDEESGEYIVPETPVSRQEAPSYETMRLHFMEAGNGEPLILVHTVGQSLYTWRLVYERLSQYYRVIAVDLPGHGYSDRPASFGYTVEEYAMALRLFMDAMNIESSHFVGFSLGAAYVMQLALEHPERVGKTIMLAPGGVVNEMPLSIRMIDSTVFGSLASLLYSRKTVVKILEDCFFDLTCLKEDMIDEYYRPASDPEARRAIRYSIHYFDDSEVIRNSRNIDVPVLIIQGGEDKWRTREATELLHAALPEAGYSVIRNAGHIIQEEKPERLVSAILEFIPVVMA